MAEAAMRRFEGRVAVVTGSASGIGRATAQEFAGEGASVVLLDIDEERGRETERAIGASALFLQTDVSSHEACARAASEGADRFGGIDCVVNAAVSFTYRGIDVTPEDWETCLRVNVQGYSHMVQVCAPALERSGYGAVVNIASISAHIAQPGRWTYNATKGAVTALTRCQALDLASQGIRVNSVSPAWVWTPEVDRIAGGDRAHWEAIWGSYHMLRRCAEPREVARAILFLCSDDASFITATDLWVDGGYLGMGHEGVDYIREEARMR